MRIQSGNHSATDGPMRLRALRYMNQLTILPRRVSGVWRTSPMWPARSPQMLASDRAGNERVK